MKTLSCLVAFYLLMTSVAHAARVGYGAIAYANSTHYVAWSTNQVSAEIASRRAMGYCKGADCQVVGTFQNSYAALAISEDGQTFFTTAASYNQAINLAVAQCKAKFLNGCRWRAWANSMPNDDAVRGQAAVRPVPSIPLFQIGGAFSYFIPNLAGFRQIDSSLCWAAAVETIYFRMTGAHLDQSEVARIHDTSDFDNPLASAQSIDSTVCDIKKNPDCNHTGNPWTALSDMGNALPFEMYPKKDDVIGLYGAIKASLLKNIPVGLTIRWPDGQTHEVVGYGAQYKARSPQDPTADVTIAIYDPEPGVFAKIHNGEYISNFSGQAIIGMWGGRVTLGNYADTRFGSVKPQACQFLATNDRVRFCRGL